jgi:hypothetical protein
VIGRGETLQASLLVYHIGGTGTECDRFGLVGHGPMLFAGLSKHIDLKLVSRLEFGSGAVAMRYEPKVW